MNCSSLKRAEEYLVTIYNYSLAVVTESRTLCAALPCATECPSEKKKNKTKRVIDS